MVDSPPEHPLELTDIVRTSLAAPSRWTARTRDGRPVDIRLRHGDLTIRIGPEGGSIDDAKLAPACIDIMPTRDQDSWAAWAEVAAWSNLKSVDGTPVLPD